MSKLYIGRLPYETTADELRVLFAEVGEVVDATVITDKMSGRSRGFGFVEMKTEEEANKAIEALNGKQVGKMNITVALARPLAPRA